VILYIEASRIALASIFFLYAAWSDYKTREVTNTVWILFAPLAFTATFLELLFYAPPLLYLYGLCFALTSAFTILLFYLGGFGGADAKALMCLALALPFYPEKLLKPLSGEISIISQNFLPFTVFSNSVIIAAATSIYLLIHNIIWHKKTGTALFEDTHKNEAFWRKILVLITGYKVQIRKLKEKWHFYPLEDLEEKSENELRRKLIVVPNDEEREVILERLTKAIENGKIKDMIWTSPGLPMLIFITAGLFTALLFGDFAWILICFLFR
jgi:preflagellin peptidase FlaK